MISGAELLASNCRQLAETVFECFDGRCANGCLRQLRASSSGPPEFLHSISAVIPSPANLR